MIVIDEHLGLSASGWAECSGFGRLTAEVALGRVGIELELEVSRLAAIMPAAILFDLCGVTDTLVGDGDGVYHPALFNDRLRRNCTLLRARLEGEAAIKRRTPPRLAGGLPLFPSKSSWCWV